MRQELPKILFFTAGIVPTAEEKFEALELGVPVLWRNGLHVNDAKEECDGVAGTIPAPYADHKSAEDALTEYKESLSAFRQTMADVGGPANATGGAPAGEGGSKVGEQGQGTDNAPAGQPAPPADAPKAGAAATDKAPGAKAGGKAAEWKPN